MHVFQVGVGSGGIVALDLVARDPRVTRVTVVDPDTYQPHNVRRHLFPPSAVGRLKCDLAADWVRDRRPDVRIDVLPVDLTAAEHQPAVEAAAAACDLGVCGVDNEPAKYHFDRLMRCYHKPWALGEVLSGGIGGWVHRFVPGGPCYGCVASHLQRAAPGDPAAPPADYADPAGAVRETTVPADRASISAVASLHAVVALGMLGEPAGAADDEGPVTSVLVPLARVAGVFDDPFRGFPFRVPRLPGCLVCGPPGPAGGDLDAALDQALARLGDE